MKTFKRNCIKLHVHLVLLFLSLSLYQNSFGQCGEYIRCKDIFSSSSGINVFYGIKSSNRTPTTCVDRSTFNKVYEVVFIATNSGKETRMINGSRINVEDDARNGQCQNTGYHLFGSSPGLEKLSFINPGETRRGSIFVEMYTSSLPGISWNVIELVPKKEYMKYAPGSEPKTNSNNISPNSNNTGSSSSSNPNNSQSSSTFNSSNLQDAINRLNEYCTKSYYKEDIRTTNLMNIYCNKTYQQTQAELEKVNKGIRELEASLREYDEKMGTNKKAEEDKNKAEDERIKKAEEERLQAQSKILVQKTADFTDLINEGDAELNSDNYDAAISKYNQAKNLYIGSLAPQEEAYARDAIILADARIAAAQKAKADKARENRIKKQKETDNAENAVYGTTATAVLGLMAIMKDKYAYKSTYFKLQAGLGYENLPMVSNIEKNSKSETTTSTHPTILVGCKFGFLNNKGVSIHFTPTILYGINALSEGISGEHFTFGGTSTLLLSPKSSSVLKGFVEGGYFNRSGGYVYDYDAASAASGTATATDRIETADYNYSFLRYGGGVMFHFINKSKLKETFIKPGIFFDKMSFASNTDKPSMVFNLQSLIASFILLDVSYSKNYAIGGTLEFPTTYRSFYESQNFWSIKIIKQGL